MYACDFSGLCTVTRHFMLNGHMGPGALAEEQLLPLRLLEHVFLNIITSLQLVRCQYLYFCNGKASKTE